MATGSRFAMPYAFAADGNGAPRAGGKLEFFTSGTTSHATTYSDATLTTPNTNPVVADANGVFGSIFLDPVVTYKAVLSTSADVQVWSADPVYPQPTSFRGALAYRATTLSVATGVDTAMGCDAELYDTDGFHDLVSNRSRLTVPAGVTYVRLAGGMQWASNGTGNRIIHFQKNGAAFQGNCINTVPASLDALGRGNIVSAVIPVVAGDYFEVFVTQTSGGNLNLDANTTTWFAIEVIR